MFPPKAQRVHKHTIKLKKKNRSLKTDLIPFCRPTPPKKTFGFPLREYIYLKNQKDSTRIWNYLDRKFGASPLWLNDQWVPKSESFLINELRARGYYNAEITTKTTPKFGSRKSVKVSHTIDQGEVYKVFDFQLNFEDASLDVKYNHFYPETPQIVPGSVFSRDAMEKQRSKVLRNLHNLGYYRINATHLQFLADTLSGNRLVDLSLEIRNAEDGSRHKTIQIRKIFIETNFDPLNPISPDTLEFAPNVYFLSHGVSKVRPDVLARQINFEPDGYLLIKSTENSYRNLSKLGVYQNISIRFPKVEGSERYVDCKIQLRLLPKYSISAETRLESRISDWKNNLASNFGINGRVSFDVKNLLKGAENLRISLGGGLEPFLITDSLSSANDLLLNTFEFGPLVRLTIPKLLFPTFGNRIRLSDRAKTEISASYNILSNIDLKRQELKLDFRYAWQETDAKRHTFSPVSVSSIKLNPSPSLSARLDSITDPFITNAYRDHLIIASAYSFSMNQQRGRNGFYLYTEVEGAGNFMEGLSSLFVFPENEFGRHKIWNIQYAQYLKTDADIRYYHKVGQESQWAFRFFGGLGLPFGRNGVLPFQKSYFGGGANGIRAWKARTLGPGSYDEALSFGANYDRIGDVMLESNTEFRFPIIGFLKGALFVDAGNVWTLDPLDSRPEGAFDTDFYKDMAIGGGFGARVDFEFFILRLDLGYRLRDPGLDGGEKWFFQSKRNFNAAVQKFNEKNGSSLGSYGSQGYNISFGIGYPF